MICKNNGTVYKILSLYSMVVICSVQTTYAQSWMKGYNYRKKITINKSQVAGNVNLSDFPLMIELTDEDLSYIPGQCNNKISGPKGLDISFASSLSPSVPLSFELDSYDPYSGRLICWVKIGSLSAAGSISDSNAIYLYYGSNKIHSPISPISLSSWSDDYTRVWHMNNDTAQGRNRNSGTNIRNEDLREDTAIHFSNFIEGKIGSGIRLDGYSEGLSSVALEISTPVTISAWIKIDSIGKEQIVITNDSLGIGGFSFKIDSLGRLKIELRRYTLSPLILIGKRKIDTKTWNYVAVVTSDANTNIYLNGEKDAVIGSSGRLGLGGTIKVGSNGHNDGYFDGDIDEIRIQNVIRDVNWIGTAYNNQAEPSMFYALGSEERNPSQTITGAVFNGAADEDWDTAANWNLAEPPSDYMNLIVKAGKNLKVNKDLIVNKLILEEAASLTMEEGSEIRTNCDILNNGTIITERFMFSGFDSTQVISGTGLLRTEQFQNLSSTNTGILKVDSDIQIVKSMKLDKGIVRANGNILFLSDPQNGTAVLFPITDTATATIQGMVEVEQYIAGSFPSPATARGWRLLGSPVYHSDSDNILEYSLTVLKNSMFVTGHGGAANGFDSSPNNNSTIYTHDQSLPGSLSQKYISIPDMDLSIPLGKGIYAFSRGGRDQENAYLNQIQKAPFVNPESYVITHKGRLFTGELIVDVFNENSGEEGDGFNLLANPYAAPIKWGSLEKENLSPFIWTYDPLNNAYNVTDDENNIIPTGSGFFVKVNTGYHTGSLVFRETSKYVAMSVIRHDSSNLRNGHADKRSNLIQEFAGHNENFTPRLSLLTSLSRDLFKQQYKLILDKNGCDEVNDADALKIGEGFVSIAGIAENGTRLSVDERLYETKEKEFKLYTKGWGAGEYTLTVKGIDQLNKNDKLMLIDSYLNIIKPLEAPEASYTFVMDPKIPLTEGDSRFRLKLQVHPFTHPDKRGLLDSMETLVYPNPFSQKLYIKAAAYTEPVEIVVRDPTGKMTWSGDLKPNPVITEIQTNSLISGLYFLELKGKYSRRKLKSIKIIKY